MKQSPAPGKQQDLSALPKARGLDFLRIKTPDQVRQEEIDAAEERQNQEPLTGLASYLEDAWEQAKSARSFIDNLLLQCLRQRKGEYSQDKLEAIKREGGSSCFLNMTLIKCLAAESFLSSTLIPNDDRPWAISPTPIPELPQEIVARINSEAEGVIASLQAQGINLSQQNQTLLIDGLKSRAKEKTEREAKDIAANMTKAIDDVLIEGGWENSLLGFIYDLCTYPSAFLKAPVLRKRKRIKWGEGYEPIVEDRIVIEVDRVSPFDLYPSPGAVDIEDGYLFERHRLSISDLNALRGSPGYDDGAIRAVIDEYGHGGLREWTNTDSERDSLQERKYDVHHMNLDEQIDALEFWGSVPGDLLRDWGLTEEQVPDKDKTYSVNAWKIGEFIIKATINADPLARRPYFKSSWINVPGSFWGQSPPMVIKHLQDAANATIRAMLNNLALASGPQAVVDMSSLQDGQDPTSMHPWKIWQVDRDKYAANSNAPISFFQPNANSRELIEVLQRLMNLADETLGIPAYMYGDVSRVRGAGDTASGLSMMIDNASAMLKRALRNVDTDIIVPLIERLYQHLMRYSEDTSIKGDAIIVGKGSTSLLVKEQQALRLREFLQATLNPIDSQIMGNPGRAKLLAETAKALHLPHGIIPTEEELMQQLQQQQIAQQQPPPTAPVATDAAGNPSGGVDARLFGR